MHTTTTTIVLRPFVRYYRGEPVREETFTHPPSWSSSSLYQFLPSTWSIASSLFKLHAWWSFCTISLHVLFHLVLINILVIVTYDMVAFCLQLCATLVQHPSSMICDVYSRFLLCQRLGIGEVWQDACSWVKSRLCRMMTVSQVTSVCSPSCLSQVYTEVCVQLTYKICFWLHFWWYFQSMRAAASQFVKCLSACAPVSLLLSAV